MSNLFQARFAAVIACIAAIEALPAFAQTTNPPVITTNQPATMPLRMIGTGVIQLGEVTLDKARRSVSFPAMLNLNEGPMEYFLVTDYGKTHESIFKTAALPYHIHIAMLLLDAKGSGTNTLPPPPGPPDPNLTGGSPVSNPGKDVLPGDNVTVEVAWTDGGKETRRRAEELIFNEQIHSTMNTGRWVYNGSQVLEGMFAAQLSGSVIALITDPDALVNNASPGHDNDKIWTANTNALPPWKTPLQVTIKLEPNQPKKPPAK